MKKYIAYLLAIVVASGVLSGCWGGDGSQSTSPSASPEVVETHELVPPEVQADTDLSSMSELNDSDELDSIQKELDETKILDEDFSDSE